MNPKLLTILTIVTQITSTFPLTIAQPKLELPLTSKVEQKFECNVNILSFMNFRYNLCVQIVRGYGRYSVDCIPKIIQNSQNITFYMRTMSWLLQRNITKEESPRNINNRRSTKSCENFLIFVDSINTMKLIVKAAGDNSNSTGILFAFSRLYFVFDKMNYNFNRSKMTEISQFFYEKAQYGYIFEFDPVTNELGLRDLISLSFINIKQHITTEYSIHPFIDRRNKQKSFRVRFSHCYPYVIVIDAQKLRFTGVEFHLLEQVTKNWNVTYLLYNFINVSRPQIYINELANDLIDIRMCSVWLTELDYYEYDLSTFHNHECYTLLVPKPVKLSEVTAIYRTMSSQVWVTFGICFFVIGFLIWGIAKIQIIQKTVYANLSRTFLEVTNIATSHGVGHFPEQYSANILLLSWILLCLWIGICYTTVYTSLLTSPGYTKIIDSIEDFLDNDMFYGVRRLYKVAEVSLSSSSNPAYQQLQKRCRVFKDRDDIETSVKSGKYAVFGAVSNGKYFTSVDWINETSLFTNFRFMKKNCIFNHYSVFAFKKFSPYTELFSDHALRFQEYGFSHYWYKKIYRDKRHFETFFEDYPKETKHPKQLNLPRIRGALLIIIICLILSAAVFLCELIFK